MVEPDKDRPNDFYIGEQFNIISALADKIGDYSDFKNRYSEMITQKPTSEIWNGFFICFFKKVLEDGVTNYIGAIENRKRLRIQLIIELKGLKTIKKRLLLNNLTLQDLHSLKEEIGAVIDRVQNQFELNKISNFDKWRERIISFILGLLGGFLLFKLGFT